MRFPVITIPDMVRAQQRLIEHLGVRQLAMVAGGSIGGQQALEWAVTYPELVEKAIVVAATAALTAQAIALSEVQRQAIMAIRSGRAAIIVRSRARSWPRDCAYAVHDYLPE